MTSIKSIKPSAYLYINFLVLVYTLCTYNAKAQGGKWMWVNGNDSGKYSYGIKGTFSKSNQPPPRYEGAFWVDLKGNFWIFGGSNPLYNDLWKYNPVTNEWVWMNGPKTTTHSAAVYGTLKVPSTSNYPSARGFGANCWTDKKGDLWLFGGLGYDSTGTTGQLDELWRYHIATNEWTWMGGSKLRLFPGNYGTVGIASSTNWPPATQECKSGWVDDDNNLWMFGGLGVGNNMWKYDISINEWTDMKGDSRYKARRGTIDVEDSLNIPAASTLSYVRWKDCDGNFYIYNSFSAINDMWRFNPKTNNWAWMWGDTTGKDSGTYKSFCTPNNHPAPRLENTSPAFVTSGSIMWTFGGYVDYHGVLNDLWYYDPKTYKWTWVSGTTVPDDTGHYGKKGVASLTNMPYAREGPAVWTDSLNNLWMFSGGDKYGASHANDLWKFTPDKSCVQYPPCATVVSFVSLFADSVICKGRQLTVSYTGFTNISVSPYNHVTLDTATKAITFSPLVTTHYTIYYSTKSGKDSLRFTLYVLQPDTVIKDTWICAGSKYVLPKGRIVDSTGRYVDTFANYLGCDSFIVTVLHVTQPSVTALHAVICANQTYTLPKGERVGAAGTYTDTLTRYKGCDSIVITTVQVNSLSADSISIDMCEGNTYILPKGEKVKTTGIYHDTLTNYAGCDSTVTTTINVWLIEALFNISPGRIVLKSDSIAYLHNETTNYSSLTWVWQGKVIAHLPDTSIKFSKPGEYCFTLKATNSLGCIDTVTHCIVVIDTAVIIIPNAFTPNGDGNNDVFFPIVRGNIYIKEFRVYDRWGLLVYDKPVRGWDGTWRGQAQPQGTYVYTVIALDLHNPNAFKEIKQKGDVELIR